MTRLGWNWKKSASAAAILGFAFAFAGHAQSTPATQGKAVFQRTCSVCHSITTVTSRRLTPAGWANVVDTMVSRGAQATPAEQRQILHYLNANFGVGSSALKNAASEKASAPVQTQPAVVLDITQIARAKQLLAANGCLSCHRVDGDGSFAGPYLGDVGATHSVEQIRSSLISPGKQLAPRNRFVRLVTREGVTVVGKLLNQDAFSVQLIDAAGRLLSFQRANLEYFKIVTVNPMPSYANKMTPQDLSLLVKYLETRMGTAGQ